MECSTLLRRSGKDEDEGELAAGEVAEGEVSEGDVAAGDVAEGDVGPVVRPLSSVLKARRRDKSSSKVEAAEAAGVASSGCRSMFP